jgi:hypothetical protein
VWSPRLAYMSAVTGSDLNKRIEAIMSGQIRRGLRFGQKLLLVAADEPSARCKLEPLAHPAPVWRSVRFYGSYFEGQRGRRLRRPLKRCLR